jgi:hypothetical protein
MNEKMNKTPNTDSNSNPGLDQEFSVLIQSAVRSALSEDISSLPDREDFKKLLTRVPVASPYQEVTEPTRSNIKKTNRTYSSVVHAWKITIPVVALVLAVSGSTYYYATVPALSDLKSQNSGGVFTDNTLVHNSNTYEFVTDIESLINSEIESELENTRFDTAEDLAIATSDTFDVNDFATTGDIES